MCGLSCRIFEQPCIWPAYEVMLHVQNFLFQGEQISTSKTRYIVLMTWFPFLLDLWPVLQDLQTALHWACQRDSVACAELLISKGADINIKDKVHCADDMVSFPSAVVVQHVVFI